MTNEERKLPDLWWISGHRRIPHAYTCPALMTVSMWWHRLRGKDVHWYRGSRTEDGAWITPARVYVAAPPVGSNGKRNLWEASCVAPRKLILAECAFWSRPAVLRWTMPRPAFKFE